MAKITFLLLGQTTFSNLGDDRVNIFPHPTKLLPDHLLVEIIIKRLQHYMPTKHLTHLLFSLSCNGPQLHMNSRFFAKIMQLPTYPTQPRSSQTSSSLPGQVCRSSKRPQCSVQGLPSWQRIVKLYL